MTPKQFEKWLKTLGKETSEKVTRVMIEGGNKIQKEAVNTVTQNSFDTGRLANDIQSSANILEGVTIQVEVGCTVPYAPHVEYGTGPHTTSNGSENFKADLKIWCARHGLPFYPVYRKIVKMGIKEKPFLIPAYNKIAPQVEKALEKVLKEMK